jgi:superfamily I DNA and/or RNA helicase
MRPLLRVTDEIEVASVTSQGRERDRVIVSLVNTDHIGFIEDPKRVDVMLIRARKQLVVLENLQILPPTAATP